MEGAQWWGQKAVCTEEGGGGGAPKGNHKTVSAFTPRCRKNSSNTHATEVCNAQKVRFFAVKVNNPRVTSTPFCHVI